MTMTYNPTWFERATMPDLITRGLNVGSGAPTQAPNPDGTVPYVAAAAMPWLTQPAMRPTVVQRFLNFNVAAGTSPTALAPNRMEAIGVIFNVVSTVATSAFWGPSNVSTASGIEIRPGLPAVLSLDQVREQWELQRALEHIGALLAAQTGSPQMGPYMAPRVILDLSTIYLIANPAITVNVLVFLPPEMQ
jgi:hypothetical protein